ncbi:MAG TPA: DUF3179 domain-containing (seleno)protein [Puia sp.]|nr:DUF3179 domain-containing (seleno)protein [Puia sp.]
MRDFPRVLLLLFGFLLLFAAEILRVYFIMPFPGSQKANTIHLAYFIDRNIVWIRLVAVLMILYPLAYILRQGKIWKKVLLTMAIVAYLLVAYAFNFKFLADKMFYQPKNKLMVSVIDNRVDTNSLVIATELQGQSKAYPIEIIGYHHQVQDTIGGVPVLVTYCTVCRTGAIFNPYVHNKYTHFRLVGMDHFNAMFEDEESKSWWRQVNGEAIAGPLRGEKLREFSSFQMRLGAWIREHPNTLILQPDTVFQKDYDDLIGYDSGTIKGSLEKRDSGSWNNKSWVVGLVERQSAKAYDWNDLQKLKVINDTMNGDPVLLTLEPDSETFHALGRRVNGMVLSFTINDSSKLLFDDQTRSTWTLTGNCVAGRLKSTTLQPVQSYQQFWHSWRTFHPNTTVFNTGKP